MIYFTNESINSQLNSVHNSANQLTIPLPEAKKRKLPFLDYINNFRAIAIVFIVIGHVIPYLTWNDQNIFLLTNILLSNGTVFFVFIAGYLFQYLLGGYEYKKYLLKKIKFVICPYLTTSVPAIAAYLLGIGHFSESFERLVSGFSSLQIVFICLLTGKHLGPFWFIPMISVFYILAPLFIRLIRLKYSAPIVISLSLFIPLYLPRTFPTSFIHFLPVYLLGMLVCRYEREVFNVVKKSWIFLSVISIEPI
jgi:hypothetical protein